MFTGSVNFRPGHRSPIEHETGDGRTFMIVLLHKRSAVTIDLPSWHGATSSTPSVEVDGAIALFSAYLAYL